MAWPGHAAGAGLGSANPAPSPIPGRVSPVTASRSSPCPENGVIPATSQAYVRIK